MHKLSHTLSTILALSLILPAAANSQTSDDWSTLRGMASWRLKNRPARKGEIGRVNGLAVLTDYVGGLPVRRTGQPLTIEAAITPGDGQLRFLEYAEADARISAEQAVAYAKRKIADLGYDADWKQYDIVVRFKENTIKTSGPSAGVADAVAVLSAALELPADSSVAVTGAIGLQGQVDAVGGVVFKAAHALSRPEIRTVIVPVGMASIDDLGRLFRAEPALLLGKQIILAKNMEQVLRYALIGYDEEKRMEAEKKFEAGLRAYVEGNTPLAVREVEAASKLTPENATYAMWRDLLQYPFPRKR